MSKKYFHSDVHTLPEFKPQNIPEYHPAINNIKSELRRPILYYSNDDFKKILQLRKRSPLLRLLKVKEEFDPLAPLMKIKKIKMMYSQNIHRKNLKYLKTFSIFQLSNTNISTLLYFCRRAESIVINSSMITWDHTWRQSLEFTKLRYFLTKHTKRIEISHNDDGLTYIKKLLMFLRICKLKQINGISHINKCPVVMWPKNKFHKLLPYINRISEIVSEMPWLNEFYFSPMTLFCHNIDQYMKSLAKIKRLEKIGFPIFCLFWWADDESYGDLVKTYFNNAISLINLTHVTVDITFFQSVNLLDKIITDSKRLKSLNLTYVALETEDQFSEKLHQALGKLKDLNFLENLCLCPLPLKVDLHEEVIHFPISHFSNLKFLKSLTLNNTCKIDLDMIEFFPVLQTLPSITKLVITGTMDCPYLIPHNKSDTWPPSQLTILHFTLEYIGNSLTTDEKFINWFKGCQSLKELEFSIATKLSLKPKLNARQLETICEGIGYLENLHYLKFSFGSPPPSDFSILEGFDDPSKSKIVSRHLSKLLKLRRLVLRMGSSYLKDEELRKIIGWFKNCLKLQNLALELNCKDISTTGFDELIDFVEYSKNQMLLNSLLIKTHQSNGDKKEELSHCVNKFYLENVKFYSLDYI